MWTAFWIGLCIILGIIVLCVIGVIAVMVMWVRSFTEEDEDDVPDQHRNVIGDGATYHHPHLKLVKDTRPEPEPRGA